eukprot:5793840-Pleurochrysis_carterae.AAC.1
MSFTVIANARKCAKRLCLERSKRQPDVTAARRKRRYRRHYCSRSASTLTPLLFADSIVAAPPLPSAERVASVAAAALMERADTDVAAARGVRHY